MIKMWYFMLLKVSKGNKLLLFMQEKNMFVWNYAGFSLRKSFWILAFLIKLLVLLPNQELSVLYGGPILNYGRQLSLYFPQMLCVNMTRDLAHLQLSDLHGEIRPICRTSDLQRERILICRTLRLLSLL